ncbi:hypothetical protein SDJN03_02413, partial [Cucurbita argyrosperma subsp. sororia]
MKCYLWMWKKEALASDALTTSIVHIWFSHGGGKWNFDSLFSPRTAPPVFHRENFPPGGHRIIGLSSLVDGCSTNPLEIFERLTLFAAIRCPKPDMLNIDTTPTMVNTALAAAAMSEPNPFVELLVLACLLVVNDSLDSLLASFVV